MAFEHISTILARRMAEANNEILSRALAVAQATRPVMAVEPETEEEKEPLDPMTLVKDEIYNV